MCWFDYDVEIVGNMLGVYYVSDYVIVLGICFLMKWCIYLCVVDG